jgi:hypothetical protein
MLLMLNSRIGLTANLIRGLKAGAPPRRNKVGRPVFTCSPTLKMQVPTYFRTLIPKRNMTLQFHSLAITQ